MESRCEELRKTLKEKLQNHRYGQDIQIRLKSLSNQLLRIQSDLVNANWVRFLFDSYQIIITNLPNANSTFMIKLIKDTEDLFISSLVSSLQLPALIFTSILDQSRSEIPDQSLESILPRFLSNVFFQRAAKMINRSNISFCDFWAAFLMYSLLSKSTKITSSNVWPKKFFVFLQTLTIRFSMLKSKGSNSLWGFSSGVLKTISFIAKSAESIPSFLSLYLQDIMNKDSGLL